MALKYAKKRVTRHKVALFYLVLHNFCLCSILVNMAKETYFNKKTGYIQIRKDGVVNGLHRFIVEENIGRKLKKEEFVHHKNGDKKDNRLENLELMDRKDHASMHAKSQIRKKNPDYTMKCEYCNKNFIVAYGRYNSLEKKNKLPRFCCKDCLTKFLRTGINTVTVKCNYCKKEFEMLPTLYRRNIKLKLNNYCSRDCLYKKRKKVA